MESRLARPANQLSLSAARKQRLSLSESRTWRIAHCQTYTAEYNTQEITPPQPLPGVQTIHQNNEKNIVVVNRKNTEKTLDTDKD